MAKEVETAVQEKTFPAPSLKALDVIIAPVVTEKSMHLQQSENKVTVKVAPNANKEEIKDAFEAVFQVKVVGVNVINVRPRAKRVGRYQGKVPGYKKAIITISKDTDINAVVDEASAE